VAANEARFLSSGGLLTEPAAIQLLTAPQDQSDAAYLLGTYGSKTAQGDGSWLIENSASGAANGWIAYQVTTPTSAAQGEVFTFSVWVKSSDAGTTQMRMIVKEQGGAADDSTAVNHNLTAGWNRVTVTHTVTQVDSTQIVAVCAAVSAGAQEYLVKDWQLEQTAHATSFMPDTGTRAADVITVGWVTNLVNDFTYIFQFTAPDTTEMAADGTVFQFKGSAAGDYILAQVLQATNVLRISKEAGGDTFAFIDIALTAEQEYEIKVRCSSTDGLDVWVDEVLQTQSANMSNATSDFGSTLSTLSIGCALNNTKQLQSETRLHKIYTPDLTDVQVGNLPEEASGSVLGVSSMAALADAPNIIEVTFDKTYQAASMSAGWSADNGGAVNINMIRHHASNKIHVFLEEIV
jgi:hypothetical protein